MALPLDQNVTTPEKAWFVLKNTTIHGLHVMEFMCVIPDGAVYYRPIRGIDFLNVEFLDVNKEVINTLNGGQRRVVTKH